MGQNLIKKSSGNTEKLSYDPRMGLNNDETNRNLLSSSRVSVNLDMN